MKAFIAIVLVLILGCLGYMIWDKKSAEYRQEKAALAEFQAREAASREIAAREAIVGPAIREGRVGVGMTAVEVQRSWGRPRRIQDVSSEYGSYGIHQQWDYPEGSIIYMSAEGKVVRVKQENDSLLVRQ